MRPAVICTLALILCLALCGTVPAQEPAWTPMFDGKSLANWQATPFTGHAEVMVENGAITLPPGKPMTGVNFTGAFPKSDYEVRFEAVRQKGNDFFASLTFPVGDSFLTFVTGGWGGDIVGISSIDGWDASENETRTYFNFDNGQWYTFRLQVKTDRIMAWIGDRRIINVEIRGRALSLRRGDIKLSAPFGFASYNTAGAIRKIEYRPLSGASQ